MGLLLACCCRRRLKLSPILLLPQNDFAMADRLIVHPQAILVGAGVRARARRSALQLASWRRLKDIGLERAPIGIELNLQICCVRKPHDLIGRTNHDNFGNHTYQNQFLRHRFAPLRRYAKITQRAWNYMSDSAASVNGHDHIILAVARAQESSKLECRDGPPLREKESNPVGRSHCAAWRQIRDISRPVPRRK